MPDTTIAEVVDRIKRTYLEPPTYQPIRCWAATAMGALETDKTLQLKEFSVAEDQQMLRNGILVEVDEELVIVRGVDSTSVAMPTITVERGAYGTTLTTHEADAEVRLSPLFPRISIFEAIRDNIISLHPRLFTVKTTHQAPIAPGIYPCPDELAIDVQRAVPHQAWTGKEIRAVIEDFHPQADGRIFRTEPMVGNLWFTYRRRMAEATAVTDTMESLGVEDTWVIAVMTGALADLVVGRDLPETVVDWVTKIIDTEAVPIGSRQSLAVGLRRYRDYLVDQYHREMTAEYKPQAVRRDPFRRVGRT